MFEFFHVLPTSPLALNALVVALLASVACGIVGSYVVTRRISYIAASVAHCVLGGLGCVHYLREVYHWTFLEPIHGALGAALLAAFIIGWVSLHKQEREDTVIGAVWAVGMAVGILFIYKTPGYNQNLMSYLFGNILLVSSKSLWLIAFLDLGLLALTVLFYPQLQAVCFDEEFARLRNVRVGFYYTLLLAMTAVTVVLLSMLVGIVLVIALLTLPAATAGRFAGSFRQMMFFAALISALCSVVGLSISYAPNLPAGPTIILVAAVLYLLSLFADIIRQRIFARRR